MIYGSKIDDIQPIGYVVCFCMWKICLVTSSAGSWNKIAHNTRCVIDMNQARLNFMPCCDRPSSNMYDDFTWRRGAFMLWNLNVMLSQNYN